MGKEIETFMAGAPIHPMAFVATTLVDGQCSMLNGIIARGDKQHCRRAWKTRLNPVLLTIRFCSVLTILWYSISASPALCSLCSAPCIFSYLA